MKQVPRLVRKYIINREIDLDPIVLWRVFRGLFRARLLGKNTLRVIELFPTFACQCSCPMCSVDKYNSDGRQRLGLDDYRKLARDAAQLGATTLVILGGEPLLYRHLDKLIAIFRRKRIFVHMVSNGWTLDRDRVFMLKHAGLNSLFFSLDSMTPADNDAIRGAGHFEKCMGNIARCREADLEVGLAPVFFAGSVETGLEVVHWCHEQGIRASGGQIAPTGAGAENAILSADELQMIRDAVNTYPNFVFDWSFSYTGRMCCPAGKEKLGVTTFGDVIGCSYNPIGFGNVIDESLPDILERMSRFSHFAKDWPGCLCSEDKDYIRDCLQPAAAADRYPLYYRDHPQITPETEPRLFEKENSQ